MDINFNNIYKNKRVLVTGHTGFKGSWLSLWLKNLGAEVCGVALSPVGELNHFDLLSLEMRSEICDIRNKEETTKVRNLTYQISNEHRAICFQMKSIAFG